MPIYEYQCQKCGNELEALQKISDEPLLDCPECGAPSLKKKISIFLRLMIWEVSLNTAISTSRQWNLLNVKSKFLSLRP